MTENRGELTDGGYQSTNDTDARSDSGLVAHEEGDSVEELSTVGDSRPCYEPDSILS